MRNSGVFTIVHPDGRGEVFGTYADVTVSRSIEEKPTRWARVGAELREQAEIEDEAMRERQREVSCLLRRALVEKPRPVVEVEATNRHARRAAMARARKAGRRVGGERS